MPVDHYNTLGVLPGASSADLRTAYLKLARANHPDKFDGTQRAKAEDRMQQINEAWNVLGVAHKRREYDQSLPTQPRAAAGGSQQRRGRTHFQAFDDEPIVNVDIDLDATPIAGSKDVPRWVAFTPILLFIGGVLILGFGTMVSSGGVFALGLASIALGAVGFLLLPLIVMSRAERDPNL